MADVISLLKNNPTLKNCKDQCLADISNGVEYIKCSEGSVIFSLNELAGNVFAVCYGSVRLTKPNAQGRDTILSFLRTGDFAGAGVVAPGESNYPANAIAHEDCGLIKIPKKIYLEVWMRKPEIAQVIHSHLMTRIMEFQTEKSEVTLPVPKKIASFLVRTLDQQPQHYGNRINFPLTRKDIADRVGTSVETVIRVLSDWTQQSVIATNDKHIEVLDRKFLQSLLNAE